MQRRHFIAGATALAMPSIARAEASRVLKFIPQSDVTVIDPIWTTAYNTRNHAFMVFDTLLGMDSGYQFQPQMLEGFTTEADCRLWRLTLRAGLRFHDGSPVLARDCVASIRRWAARDALGGILMAATAELSAPDDRVIQFRLTKPFPLLPMALGKTSTPMCAMMPERLARTDPFKQITEMVGSGPYKFKADERNVGHLVVYERNAGYVPRSSGTSDWTAGPKIVNFDRVEWHVIPDVSTAAAALQNGEVDWWETPTGDVLPLLRKAGLTVAVTDPTGLIGCMRFNQLQPPFDNPAIRRAILGAVSQEDFNLAIVGDDPTLSHTGVGVFTPGTPLASNVGMEALAGKRDYDKVKRDLAAAGYKGEKVVFLAPTDLAVLKMQGDVAGDMLKRAGLNVNYASMDWGTLIARRAKKDPPAQGGWNIFCTTWAGLATANPGSSNILRGNGGDGWFGWATMPKMEALRDAWFDAPDLAAQQKIARDMQLLAFEEVPVIPTGMYFTPTAYRSNLTGILKSGTALMWGVKRG